jgi:hypothetical protein
MSCAAARKSTGGQRLLEAKAANEGLRRPFAQAHFRQAFQEVVAEWRRLDFRLLARLKDLR